MLATREDAVKREGLFASTRWTLVLDAAQSTGSAGSLRALSDLCGIYWRPLYLFLRRQGFNAHDAQDLTQGFFVHLIETRAYTRAEPAKGRFRSFLLGVLKHFLANSRDHDLAKKRGGGAIRIPIAEVEIQELEGNHRSDERSSADRVYEREWAQALLRRALDRTAQEWTLAGKSTLFHELKSHLSGTSETALAYDEISKRLGRPAATLRSDMARLRARYRAILREEVHRTVEDESHVDEELRYLCRAIAAD